MTNLLLLSCWNVFILMATSQSPPDLIDLVVQTLWSSNSPSCSMYAYQYGGAIVFDSLYRCTDQFSPHKNNFNTTKILDYNHMVSPVLSYYLYNDTSTPGYMITHGQTISFNSSKENAIGDVVGLFPITYLDELLYQFMKNNDNDVFNFNGKYSIEWQLIFTTADHYILQFPRRLPDKYGTVSRNSHGSWQNQPNKNASFIWADDNFMGLTLLTRLVQILDFCDKKMNSCNGVNVKNNISTYIDFVYNQHMGFSQSLIYPHSQYNGLYAHGYNYATNDRSCCPWGRANAWVMTSRVEAIDMYLYLNDSKYDQQYNDIVKLFQNHLNEIGSLQDKQTGQWHQVINETSTFLEASGSTGFLRGIITATLKGILPTDVYSKKEWDEKIELGWNGLLGFINMTNGQILQACCGTGIENDVQQYEDRSTAYCSIGSPGDAAFVINAMVSYQEYLNMNNN